MIVPLYSTELIILALTVVMQLISLKSPCGHLKITVLLITMLELDVGQGYVVCWEQFAHVE